MAFLSHFSTEAFALFTFHECSHSMHRPEPSAEYLEHRRQERNARRARWLEPTGKNVYELTPSPEPSENSQQQQRNDSDDDSMLTEDEEELEQELAKLRKNEKKERKRTKEREAAEALFSRDAPLQALFAEELKLLREYLDMVGSIVAQDEAKRKKEEEENAMVGPEPLYTYEGATEAGMAHSLAGHYGKNLMPGEGSAMAAYVASGQRIPRRGEVGLDAAQIESYERAGYVMSGNRHAKMNAIRERKEGQVYTAEEKAAMAMLAFEEKKAKEEQVIKDLKKMVEGAINEANR